MVLMIKSPTGFQPPRKHVQKLDFMRLYATVYDELASEIIHFWGWPFLFPPSRRASDAALRNFKSIVTEGRDGEKKKPWFCPCFGANSVERSLFDVVPPASVASTNEHAVVSPMTHQSRSDPHLIRSHMLGEEV